jgi:hypothetical protein
MFFTPCLFIPLVPSTVLEAFMLVMNIEAAPDKRLSSPSCLLSVVMLELQKILFYRKTIGYLPIATACAAKGAPRRRGNTFMITKGAVEKDRKRISTE